ncbi:hypothetical protein [Streptomyces litchfieldiae]|uniref:Serine hydrolase n=1 Tax=Streptomyces litchfieldiae TaxID=3075543 RepID=A0ABU2MZX2_9ACTN|nr:hypothetical protein [Streptomyces sp. DSM 44938]MDT0347208.1 hypothetical protein [Streptomyces sp. DSM 44938]
MKEWIAVVDLFTGAYADNLQPEGAADRNRSMQDALNAFLGGLTGGDVTALERTALTVVALEEGIETRAWAGHRAGEVHYSASLVKLLAVYAAHTLRFFAKQLRLDNKPPSVDALFAQLAGAFDSGIKSHTPVKIMAQHGADDTKILPAYRTVLQAPTDATGKPVDVDFTPGYHGDSTGMLIHQENAPAAACVHGVAFGFMNAKAGDDGFFDQTNERGIWLAGDYQGQWTPVRIASTNDGAVAQATTAIDMARLFTRMFDGSLESGPVDLFQMLAGGARSWFHDRGIWPRGGLEASHSKVGIGPFKPNSAGVIEQAVSEALIVHDINRGMNFVVVWQNLKVPGRPTRTQLEPVARMVEATIAGFRPTT